MTHEEAAALCREAGTLTEQQVLELADVTRSLLVTVMFNLATYGKHEFAVPPEGGKPVTIRCTSGILKAIHLSLSRVQKPEEDEDDQPPIEHIPAQPPLNPTVKAHAGDVPETGRRYARGASAPRAAE